MDPQLQDKKAALRRTIRDRLKGIDSAQRARASAAACSLIQAEAIWKQSRAILFYAPMAEEPDIWPLVEVALAGNKVAALPRYDSGRSEYVASRVKDLAGDIQAGRFGIREPKGECEVLGLDQIDLVLVPGLVFDVKGNRLGRGLGFYDRLLAQYRGIKCGVCFEEQVVEELPMGAHDILVNWVLTPKRMIRK